MTSPVSSHLVLVGPMGSGKTTVGRELARRLSLPFVDLDARLSERLGPIPAYFAQHGEAAFRTEETAELLTALGGEASVIATGGGVVLAEENRAALSKHTVVSLRITAETAARRLAGDTTRPLLAGTNPQAAWTKIAADREPLYARLATVTVEADQPGRDGVVEEVLAALTRAPQGENMSTPTTSTVHVSTPEGPGYDVVLGRGLLSQLAPVLGERTKKVLVIHPRALRTTGDTVREQLQADGFEAITAEIPDAEEGKRVEVAAFCWQIMGQSDFTRTDAIVAVGGGSVTDLGGFVAATWLRGVRWVAMPTTFLGMVDAAVGGKTGINTAEGKNLVGAFHPPVGVLADFDALETLPRNELLAGMAEAVKCGFIADPAILDLFEADLDSATDPHSEAFAEIVRRTIQVKAEVVGEDLFEAGRREFLNYGHTLAHAIEHAERYQWRHGAAVSVGLVFAAELGRLVGRLDDATADRTRAVLESLGLPVSYRADRWKTLLATMRRDKKSRGDHLRFIILDGLGRPAVLEAPEDHLLFTAYQEVAS